MIKEILLNKISPVLFIVLVCWVLLKYKKSETNKKIESNIFVYGTLIDISYYSTVRFEINGKIYDYKDKSSLEGREVGEMFKIYYTKDNPDDYIVKYSEPYIVKEKSSITKIIDFEKRNLLNGIKFHYTVNKVDYVKLQLFDDVNDFDDKSNFEVVYRTDNPKIAYVRKKK